MLTTSTGLFRFISYHSKLLQTTLKNMQIKIIPALEDNYMYLLIDEKTKQAAAVDPVEPEKIIKAAEEEKVKLTAIFTTHHHWDHASGNKQLISMVKGLSVYGGDDRIDGLTEKVADNHNFKFGSLSVKTLFTPCHTTGHICYFVESNDNQPVVFTGDTLFVSACGKFFEGTPDQMYDALIRKLGKLPLETKVYCGHEYSVNSLKYARVVEPGNICVQKKLEWAMEQRQKNCPTIPSTIGEEFSYNPFMRVDEESMHSRCNTSTGTETMEYLRNEKNNFKPNA